MNQTDMKFNAVHRIALSGWTQFTTSNWSHHCRA